MSFETSSTPGYLYAWAVEALHSYLGDRELQMLATLLAERADAGPHAGIRVHQLRPFVPEAVCVPAGLSRASPLQRIAQSWLLRAENFARKHRPSGASCVRR